MSEPVPVYPGPEERGLNWEPKEEDRSWYSHSISGNRGYLCKRAGREMIRLDRPNDPHQIMPYDPGTWIVDRERRPLTSMASTQIAFAADRMLCRALGMHDKAKKEWMDLREQTRIAWMEQGPQDPEIRRQLYLAIRTVLLSLEE